MNNDVDKIEMSMAHSETLIAKKQIAIELYDNPLFNKLVVKEYFETEAIRLVGLYGSGTLDEEDKIAVERDMYAIGAFQRFLRRKVSDGQQAERDLEALKNEREEILAAQADAKLHGYDLPGEIDPDYAGNLGA